MCGYYQDEIAAAIAYDAYVITHYPSMQLNFPTADNKIDVNSTMTRSSEDAEEKAATVVASTVLCPKCLEGSGKFTGHPGRHTYKSDVIAAAAAKPRQKLEKEGEEGESDAPRKQQMKQAIEQQHQQQQRLINSRKGRRHVAVGQTVRIVRHSDDAEIFTARVASVGYRNGWIQLVEPSHPERVPAAWYYHGALKFRTQMHRRVPPHAEDDAYLVVVE